MDIIRATIFLAFVTGVSTVQAQALQQPRRPGFVPRHQRIARVASRPAAPSVLGNQSRTSSRPQAVSEVPPLSPVNPTHDATDELLPPSPSSVLQTQPTALVDGEEESLAAPSVMDDATYDSGQDVVMDYGYGNPVSGTDCGYCWIDTFSLNLGVAGFKNALNNGHSGSFGFQEGINWGTPYEFVPLGMNMQIGFRAIQSEFSGTQFDGGNTNSDHRSQFFVTGGFFKRVTCGWQGGIVFDFLRDEWISDVDLGQVRGELSWAVPTGSSFGFWFTSSTDESTGRPLSNSSQTALFETRDMYALFYRVQSNQHRLGQWRVFAGLTGEDDGVIGSDFKLPLAGTWSLEPEFTFVIPDENTQNGGPSEEAWNVAFNLVWYPGRAVRGIDYCRLPMFDVAGNGSMVVRRAQ